MNSLDFRLVNEFQREFPLVSEPYAVIARKVGASRDAVLEAFAKLRGFGAISRIGAVFRPNAIGASTLAAMAVPADRLNTVARYVSEFREVNHNYEREHQLNLWFVVAAPEAVRLKQVLASIERTTGLDVISLPLVEEFHIDLGFDLRGEGVKRVSGGAPPRVTIGPSGQRLVAALQEGLELVPRPYAVLAARAGLAESEVIETLAKWQTLGLVRRFGVVVRHHELGFGANAMCVWDVPDAEVHALGEALAAEAAVTLCYRRTRVLPQWRYNLYCMLHGRERAEVVGALADIAARHRLGAYPDDVLFSVRRFKQTGAKYAEVEASRHG
jgi:DNA-binding Lrp family transcriptional regulator